MWIPGRNCRRARSWVIGGLLLLLATAGKSVTADDLRAIESQSTVEVTTIGRRSGLPRVVTIWFVHDEGRLYVQSGKDGKTHWYRNLLKAPEITLRFDHLAVRGRARPVEDQGEIERVHGLFRRKYFTARVMSLFGGGFGQGKVVLVESLEAAE